MKKALIAIALVSLASVFALAALEIPADKEVLTFESKKGKVTFKHKDHADLVGDCGACHHKMEEGDTEIKKCTECHVKKPAEGDDTPKRKKAFHDSCSGCHEDKKAAGEKHGPIEKRMEGDKKMKGCNDCHIKPPK